MAFSKIQTKILLLLCPALAIFTYIAIFLNSYKQRLILLSAFISKEGIATSYLSHLSTSHQAFQKMLFRQRLLTHKKAIGLKNLLQSFRGLISLQDSLIALKKLGLSRIN